MVNLVNQERVRAGLPPFTVDARIVRLARLRAQDIAANWNTTYNHADPHRSPTYGYPMDMEIKNGVRARVMGAENWAASRSIDRAHLQFMNSSGHRSNILDARHDSIGVGVAPYVVNGVSYGVVVNQLFLGD